MTGSWRIVDVDRPAGPVRVAPPAGPRIRGLALAVVVSGVALGALRSPSDTWSLVVSELTLVLLLYSLLAALFGMGQVRAYWIGFAVFGWGRFVFGHAPWFVESCGVPLERSLQAAGSWAYPRDLAPEFAEVGPGTLNLIRIGRCLMVLAFAAVGGVACRLMVRDSAKPPA